MNINQTIARWQLGIQAAGTSEGASKGWDSRGRYGKAAPDSDHIGKTAEMLKGQGYRLYQKPFMHESIDNEYIFRKAGQQAERQKDYIHLNNDNGSWEHKQYGREPFGDYTVPYGPKGKGVGTDSLKNHLEGK